MCWQRTANNKWFLIQQPEKYLTIYFKWITMLDIWLCTGGVEWVQQRSSPLHRCSCSGLDDSSGSNLKCVAYKLKAL